MLRRRLPRPFLAPDAPQAGSGGTNPTPQAGEPTTSPTPQAGGGTTTKTPDDYERMLADVRKEAAGYRTRLKGFEDAEAQRQQASLSELEKATNTLAERDKQLSAFKDQLVLEKVTNAALKKGIIDPELAALALKGSLEFGEDGMPTNLEKALDDLLKAKPYLAQQPARQASSGGATNPGRGQATGAAHVDHTFVQKVMSGQISYESLSPEEQQAVRTAMNPGRRR